MHAERNGHGALPMPVGNAQRQYSARQGDGMPPRMPASPPKNKSAYGHADCRTVRPRLLE
jgi:hypothetical protein